jgi:hypothetical protein
MRGDLKCLQKFNLTTQILNERIEAYSDILYAPKSGQREMSEVDDMK